MLVSGSVRRHCGTDEELLAKLSATDLVALEAKYHAPCLASLYEKTERVKGKAKKMGQVLDDRRVSRYAELVSFFEKLRMFSTAMLPVFRLAEPVGKYTSRLKQLGGKKPARIHTTRLKDRILSQISALEEHKQGRDVFFWPSEMVLPTRCRKLARNTVLKKQCTLPKPQALCAKKCSHRNTNLTDLLKRMAR